MVFIVILVYICDYLPARNGAACKKLSVHCYTYFATIKMEREVDKNETIE